MISLILTIMTLVDEIVIRGVTFYDFRRIEKKW